MGLEKLALKLTGLNSEGKVHAGFRFYRSRSSVVLVFVLFFIGRRLGPASRASATGKCRHLGLIGSKNEMKQESTHGRAKN